MSLSVNGDNQDKRAIRFGEFTFDPQSLELWRDGEPTHLPRQPAALLNLLLARPGATITRD